MAHVSITHEAAAWRRDRLAQGRFLEASTCDLGDKT
jgi:hypothetical protein